MTITIFSSLSCCKVGLTCYIFIIDKNCNVATSASRFDFLIGFFVRFRLISTSYLRSSRDQF